MLDVTQMLAGPLCGMRLGDLGADVIKVEPPVTGEFNRTHGFADVELSGEMTTFLALNRNKRSVAIDLKNPAGLTVFHELVRCSDVLVQNFRVGTADRLGIGWDALHALNPRLVYCTISGYGLDGPGRGRPGQDLILQGYSGAMWSVGRASDPPAPGPLWAADAMTGYQAAVGILAALIARGRTGLGQHVEVDMLSVVLDAQIQELVTYLNCGIEPERGTEPTAHAWIPAPYGVYETADSWLTMAMCPLNVLGDALDEDVLRAMTDYRDGHRRADEVYRIVRPRLRERTTQGWMDHFDQFNIWTGPVYRYSEVEKDPQVVARDLIITLTHPRLGDIRTVNVPIRMSDAAPSFTAPPMLGEHTAEVLRDLLELTDGQIRSLGEQGAVGLLDSEARS